MQSPAEKKLLQILANDAKSITLTDRRPVIINLGAGQSLLLENYLDSQRLEFVMDRLDISLVKVSHFRIRNYYQCSVEDMQMVNTEEYDIAVANFILEHVAQVEKAAAEISRILKTGGFFITSVPNATAPEFFLAKIIPFRFHSMITGRKSYPAFYNYQNIDKLVAIFQEQGLILEKKYCFSCLQQYLNSWPILKQLSQVYDFIVDALSWQKGQGQVCLKFRKR